MDALAARLVESLRRGETDVGALEIAGEPNPAAAAQAFLSAARDPDLAPACDAWVPTLLRSARPGFGAQQLEELARRERAAGVRLDVHRTPALPLVVGSSNFLARLLLRRPDWVDDLAGPLPAAPAAFALEGDWTAIRRVKYRGLLRVAARDLLGRSIDEGLQELSDLADRCLAAALSWAARETGAPCPALFALGKLGGRELNFSSDVDLLFLSDPPSPDAAPAHNQRVSRLIHRFKSGLEGPTEDGFAYRIDLDLRPEGRSGVLVNSVEAALGYYESYGAEWERQMLLRLRPIAGPGDTSQAFARGIAPFVYRRSFDARAVEAVRDMKMRIESERRNAGRDLDMDLKEGPGGIRDVEFLVQSFQLFFGGQHVQLRTGNVGEALLELGRLELLPESSVASLRDAYGWLRRAEHALQLVEERATATFPRERYAQIGLARRLGYHDAEGGLARNRLLDDWTAVRGEVRAHFEALAPSSAA